MLISLQELSELTGIPYTTVARYTKTFELFFSKKKQGRKLFFLKDESIKVATKVKLLYESGYKTEQIHEILEEKFNPIIDIKPIYDDKIISHAKEMLAKQDKRIRNLEQEIQDLKQENEKTKSEILQGVNDAMLEFMRMINDKKS